MERVAIIGGGQLGRMLAQAAQRLGFDVAVVDPDRHSPAAQVVSRVVPLRSDEPTAVAAIAAAATLVTVENEWADADALEQLVASSTRVYPSPRTIRLTQDKHTQRRLLRDAGLPQPDFVAVESPGALRDAAQKLGFPLVVKTRRGGYDGRGVSIVENEAGLSTAAEEFRGRPLLAERFVDFERELAVIVARASDGSIVTYPVVETIQRNTVCELVLAPADVPPLIAERALRAATGAARAVDIVGVIGVELFLLRDGEVLVNELAPRVHNSGHFTLEACVTSQFEQHWRAIAGLPLGSVRMLAPAAAMLNVLGTRDGAIGALEGVRDVLAAPEVKLHWYGKTVARPGRKLGHLTALSSNVAAARDLIREARAHLEV